MKNIGLINLSLGKVDEKMLGISSKNFENFKYNF